MSRREDIDNAIWSDPDFHDLSAPAKLVYLWSFTNPRCGMSGLYKCSASMICFETALTREAGEAALDELEEGAFLLRDKDVVWVRARVKHLRTRTPQIARSIANDVGQISAENRLRQCFLEQYDAAWAAENWPSLGEQLAVLEPGRGWDSTGFVSPKARLMVMERDGYQCRECGATEKLVIDHIKPRSHGGTGKVENLQVLCLACNSSKGPRDDSSRAGNPLDPPTIPLDVPMNLVEVPGYGLREGSGSSVEGTAETLDARVRDLFDYWRERCGHPAAKLTAERRRKIAARLHEGYSPEQVREGIDGAAKAPFVNEQGHRFDDIELVCRNGAKLEQFIGRVKAGGGRSRAEHGVAAAERYEERHRRAGSWVEPKVPPMQRVGAMSSE